MMSYARMLVVLATAMIVACEGSPTAPEPGTTELEFLELVNRPFEDFATVRVEDDVIVVEGGATVPDSGCSAHPDRAELEVRGFSRLEVTIWNAPNDSKPRLNCPTVIGMWKYRTRLLNLSSGDYRVTVRHSNDGWEWNRIWEFPSDTVVFEGEVTLP